ncbi:MAG: YheT family hydrolase [Gammaproteobacteria bacterium]
MRRLFIHTVPGFMPITDQFEPPRALRNGHVQSLLASLKLRAPWIVRRARKLIDDEEFVILDCANNVRLTGFYSATSDDGPLAVLIHGWEGSAQSQYMLSTSAYLYARGYRVFRFQMRDHGDSHHLNEGLFHSCRIDEAVDGVGEVQRRFGLDQPVVLGGYSLGGNFSLRIGARAPDAGIALSAIAAVCPVADPAKTLLAMENTTPVYEAYFMRKWRRSLRKKQELFPGVYDDPQWFTLKTMRELTEYLVEQYGFMKVEDYFKGYAITGDRLASLDAPSLILAANDDPIIPPEDFGDIDPPDALHIVHTRFGGHCGYIDGFRQPTFADRAVHRWFSDALGDATPA